nr:Aspartic proteinase A1 [Ipomoea batatas]
MYNTMGRLALAHPHNASVLSSILEVPIFGSLLQNAFFPFRVIYILGTDQDYREHSPKSENLAEFLMALGRYRGSLAKTMSGLEMQLLKTRFSPR